MYTHTHTLKRKSEALLRSNEIKETCQVYGAYDLRFVLVPKGSIVQ